MKIQPKEPPVPAEQHATIRQAIMAVLEGGPLSARELSARVGIAEKEVIDHLEHIRLAGRQHRRTLHLLPATCQNCGFQFSKRQRLKKPGKCPVCRSEHIEAPRYALGAKE